jgi:uncharacterized membrane protein
MELKELLGSEAIHIQQLDQLVKECIAEEEMLSHRMVILWIGGNTVLLVWKPFDPYPFILLNLILSCVAALQAPVIMMSQNRQEDKDRQRARSDYMINLKAELEIRGLHRKIDLLIAEEMKTLFEIQKGQVDILIRIQEQLDQMKPSNAGHGGAG